ncbi:MAG: hypothetical protein ACHQD6_04255 [Steroidobacterales bacterium]|jgi:hypothetical protein
MGNRLQYVGCAEADAELDALRADIRDVQTDAGSLLKLYLEVLRDGTRDLDRVPRGPFGSANLYVVYGRYVVMWFALAGSKVSLVKWLKAGTPYQHQQAQADAETRARRLFP